MYEAWVDLRQLEAEPEGAAGDVIAEASLAELHEIHGVRRKKIGRALREIARSR